METARISHAVGYSINELRRLGKFLAIWFGELLALAASYGLLLTSDMLWETRSDLSHLGLIHGSLETSKMFAIVVIGAFMNFIWTGYIFTSLIARILCVSKAPRFYPLVLPLLVAIHITVIRLKDHGWALTISYPLFVGWGAATAFTAAWFSMRMQNARVREASNTR